MDEAKYTQYDATVVTGSEVVNVIKLHSNDKIYVDVNIGGTQRNYIYSDATFAAPGANLALARDKSDPSYINPNSKFTGSIVRDATTSAIVGIVFTKS